MNGEALDEIIDALTAEDQAALLAEALDRRQAATWLASAAPRRELGRPCRPLAPGTAALSKGHTRRTRWGHDQHRAGHDLLLLGVTPARPSAFCTKASTRSARSTPTSVPLPPKMLTPPSTTAVITGSSSPVAVSARALAR